MSRVCCSSSTFCSKQCEYEYIEYLTAIDLTVVISSPSSLVHLYQLLGLGLPWSSYKFFFVLLSLDLLAYPFCAIEVNDNRWPPTLLMWMSCWLLMILSSSSSWTGTYLRPFRYDCFQFLGRLLLKYGENVREIRNIDTVSMPVVTPPSRTTCICMPRVPRVFLNWSRP